MERKNLNKTAINDVSLAPEARDHDNERAGALAAKYEQDIMVITHQLQAPLIAAMGALSSIKAQSLQPNIEQRVSYARDLIEDALYLCYGIYVSSARAVGMELSLLADAIDVPYELKKLCSRLQNTVTRPDLRLSFRLDEDFPILRMDRNVFISVFYSLIHNAMKYAAANSTVEVVCRFDRSTGEARVLVKSVGEPIGPEEREGIFEKFRRGRATTQTGRFHAGAGLGLWVARELMRAIGGNLTLELSAAEPHLSAFVVNIPHAKDEAAQAST